MIVGSNQKSGNFDKAERTPLADVWKSTQGKKCQFWRNLNHVI